MNGEITRSAFLYYGGKWRIAEWIISLLPRHKCYVEPFGGAASILLRKNKVGTEVYNDEADEVYNFFYVLREEELGKRLIAKLELTTYSRKEFEEAVLYRGDDIVERARCFFIKVNLNVGRRIQRLTKNNFDVRMTQGQFKGIESFYKRIDNLYNIINRLKEVIIENKSAIEIVKLYDTEDTLFYCDPPYPSDVRKDLVCYDNEMSREDHKKLAEVLHNVKGVVAISGYRCDLYDGLYKDWKRFDKVTMNGRSNKAMESLWISANARVRNSLF